MHSLNQEASYICTVVVKGIKHNKAQELISIVVLSVCYVVTLCLYFIKLKPLFALFHWHLWPRWVKLCCIDLHFHHHFKRTDSELCPRWTIPEVRSKCTQPASERVAVTSNGLCWYSVTIQLPLLGPFCHPASNFQAVSSRCQAKS